MDHYNSYVNRTRNCTSFVKKKQQCFVCTRMHFDAQSYEDCTITGRTYLDMLENWLKPQMNEDSDDYVFQEDDCLAHFHNDVHDYLNTNLPQH